MFYYQICFPLQNFLYFGNDEYQIEILVVLSSCTYPGNKRGGQHNTVDKINNCRSQTPLQFFYDS